MQTDLLNSLQVKRQMWVYYYYYYYFSRDITPLIHPGKGTAREWMLMSKEYFDLVRIRRTCLSWGFKFDVSLNPAGLQHAWLTQTTGCILWDSSSGRKCLPPPLKSSLCIWQSGAVRFLGNEIHINYHLGDRLTYSFFLLLLILLLCPQPTAEKSCLYANSLCFAVLLLF